MSTRDQPTASMRAALTRSPPPQAQSLGSRPRRVLRTATFQRLDKKSRLSQMVQEIFTFLNCSQESVL
jgi:hypothetical protein